MTYDRRLVFAALAASGLLWGTTVPLSKEALGWLGPAWLTTARFALAAVVLMLVSGPRLRAACKPAILITGAAGYGGAVLLQNLGVDRTSVTHAALLIGATPVLVAVVAAALGHSMPRPVAWAGFALSMLGVVVIAGGHEAGSSLSGDGLVLAAQLVSAAFTVSQAKLLPGRDPVAVTAVQLLAAAVAVLPVAVATEGIPAVPASPGPVLAVLALVLAGTVLPFTLFAFGQSRVPADVAGAFVNLEPLVGAVIGTVAFGDPLGPVQLAAGAAILAGIGLSSAAAMRRRHVGLPAASSIPAQAARAEGPVPAARRSAAAVGSARCAADWHPPANGWPGLARGAMVTDFCGPRDGRGRNTPSRRPRARGDRPPSRPVFTSGPGRARRRLADPRLTAASSGPPWAARTGRSAWVHPENRTNPGSSRSRSSR
jgi:O-acetylserine/cysteine efflux transporter